VGRTYAGILGFLAFCTTLARGGFAGGDARATVQTACLHMVVFAMVGFVIGQVATWVIEDSLRSRLAYELAAKEAAGSSPPATAAVRPKGPPGGAS